MQEGHCTIIEAVIEKKMKPGGPGQPQGKVRHPRTPAVAYDIEEWMQSLEGASNGEPKQNDNMDHGADWWNIHSQQKSQGQRRHRQQRVPRVPREPSGGSPSLGGDSSDGQSEWSSWYSNQTGVSQESGQSGWAGRDFKVKVSFPTFKDTKPKTQWPTTHGIGTHLCFATLVGMTTICCPMSLGFCKDSQYT